MSLKTAFFLMAAVVLYIRIADVHLFETDYMLLGYPADQMVLLAIVATVFWQIVYRPHKKKINPFVDKDDD